MRGEDVRSVEVVGGATDAVSQRSPLASPRPSRSVVHTISSSSRSVPQVRGLPSALTIGHLSILVRGHLRVLRAASRSGTRGEVAIVVSKMFETSSHCQPLLAFRRDLEVAQGLFGHLRDLPILVLRRLASPLTHPIALLAQFRL